MSGWVDGEELETRVQCVAFEGRDGRPGWGVDDVGLVCDVAGTVVDLLSRPGLRVLARVESAGSGAVEYLVSAANRHGERELRVFPLDARRVLAHPTVWVLLRVCAVDAEPAASREGFEPVLVDSFELPVAVAYAECAEASAAAGEKVASEVPVAVASDAAVNTALYPLASEGSCSFIKMPEPSAPPEEEEAAAGTAMLGANNLSLTASASGVASGSSWAWEAAPQAAPQAEPQAEPQAAPYGVSQAEQAAPQVTPHAKQDCARVCAYISTPCSYWAACRRSAASMAPLELEWSIGHGFLESSQVALLILCALLLSAINVVFSYYWVICVAKPLECGIFVNNESRYSYAIFMVLFNLAGLLALVPTLLLLLLHVIWALLLCVTLCSRAASVALGSPKTARTRLPLHSDEGSCGAWFLLALLALLGLALAAAHLGAPFIAASIVSRSEFDMACRSSRFEFAAIDGAVAFAAPGDRSLPFARIDVSVASGSGSSTNSSDEAGVGAVVTLSVLSNSSGAQALGRTLQALEELPTEVALQLDAEGRGRLVASCGDCLTGWLVVQFNAALSGAVATRAGAHTVQGVGQAWLRNPAEFRDGDNARLFATFVHPDVSFTKICANELGVGLLALLVTPRLQQRVTQCGADLSRCSEVCLQTETWLEPHTKTTCSKGPTHSPTPTFWAITRSPTATFSTNTRHPTPTFRASTRSPTPTFGTWTSSPTHSDASPAPTSCSTTTWYETKSRCVLYKSRAACKKDNARACAGVGGWP
jgi:hypothetical protein